MISDAYSIIVIGAFSSPITKSFSVISRTEPAKTGREIDTIKIEKKYENKFFKIQVHLLILICNR